MRHPPVWRRLLRSEGVRCVSDRETQSVACDDGSDEGGELRHVIDGVKNEDGDGGVGDDGENCRDAKYGCCRTCEAGDTEKQRKYRNW
jgi:hypothetical protein